MNAPCAGTFWRPTTCISKTMEMMIRTTQQKTRQSALVQGRVRKDFSEVLPLRTSRAAQLALAVVAALNCPKVKWC